GAEDELGTLLAREDDGRRELRFAGKEGEPRVHVLAAVARHRHGLAEPQGREARFGYVEADLPVARRQEGEDRLPGTDHLAGAEVDVLDARGNGRGDAALGERFLGTFERGLGG